MKKIAAGLLILTLLFFSWGCSSKKYEDYDIRLMALDDLAEDYIHYLLHRRVRLPSGQMKILVTFLNQHRSRDIAIDWQVKFFDQDGFEVETTDWVTTIFPREQETTIATNSISANVSDFMILIKRSEN